MSGPVPAPTPSSSSLPAVARPGRPSWGARLLATAAGVLAAGLVLLGLLLVALQVLAPTVLTDWGIAAAQGPGWARAGGHLAVGVAGEVVLALRRRWSPSVRVAADGAVVVAALAVLWWGWWS